MIICTIAQVGIVALIPYAFAQTDNSDEISAYNNCNTIKHLIQNETGDKYRSDLFQYNLFGCENMTGVLPQLPTK